MPVEHIRITLKPNNFFKWSPALDVKAEEDTHSKLAFGTGGVPADPPVAGSNGNAEHATTDAHHHHGSAPGGASSTCNCD